MVFYFSGTGNSKWVAEAIASDLQDKTVCVNGDECACEPYVLEKGERLGFVFPVYSWGMPQFFETFVRNVQVENVEYVYFVCTCGDDTGLTKEAFCEIALQRGWHVAAGYSVAMPNTYVCLPGFDVDAMEVQESKKHNASERLRAIIDDIKERKNGCFDVVPGAFPWFKSKVIRPLFNKYMITDKPFHATDKCVECGLCAKVCPKDNIVVEHRRPKWKSKCVGCLRCYHSCPVNAIQYGRFTKGKGQYLYKN